MANTVIKLYSFSKRENSTKRPSAAGTSYNATFIEDTNIINPALRMNFAANVNPVNYNYAYIADFNRYYFVSNWEMDHGFWIIHLTCDVLASAQTQIKASTEYVLRASQLTDGTIIDEYYPCKGRVETTDTQFTNGGPFYTYPYDSWNLDQYCICIATIGGDARASESVPGISYYRMTMNQFTALINWMNQSVGNYLNPTDFGQETLKSLYNPFQYIVMAKLFPLNIGSSTYTRINFGYWQTPSDLTCSVAPGRYAVIRNIRVPLSNHPQASERGTYLNLSPYSEYVMHAPPFGDIPIDTTKLIGCTHLNCQVMIDYYTGDACLYIKGAPDATTDYTQLTSGIIHTAYANIAYDMPLSQVREDYVGEVQTRVSSPANAINSFMQGSFVSGIANAVSAVGDCAKAEMPTVNIKAPEGNLLHRSLPWKLTRTSMYVVDRDLAQQGAPLCQAVSLSSVWGGYALIESADFASDVMTQEENQKIKNYLESGVFLEG